MIHAYEVKQKLAMLASDTLRLDDFEDWIVRESWNMFKDSSPETIDLVSSIHLLFSERDEKIVNEADLREELAALLRTDTKSIEIVDPPQIVWSFNSSSRAVSVPVFAKL